MTWFQILKRLIIFDIIFVVTHLVIIQILAGLNIANGSFRDAVPIWNFICLAVTILISVPVLIRIKWKPMRGWLCLTALCWLGIILYFIYGWFIIKEAEGAVLMMLLLVFVWIYSMPFSIFLEKYLFDYND